MKFLKFPDGFLWGGAMAAVQVDSTDTLLKSRTNWDLLYAKDPTVFYNEVGPGHTCNHLAHFKKDLALFKEIGANSFRTGLMWARLFPEKGKPADPEAVAFYHTYLDEAKKNGLHVSITLDHFDLPAWATLAGGYENPEIINEFVRYGEFVLKEFGDKIDIIVTFNEPIVPIIHGYLDTKHMPAVIDPKRAAQAAYGMILAHAKFSQVFYSKFASKLKTKLGVVLNIAPSIAGDGKTFSQEDALAAKNIDELINLSMINGMLKGTFNDYLVGVLRKFNIVPITTKEELEIISKVKVDVLGVNFYHPSRVIAPKKDAKNPVEMFAQPYKWPEARVNVFRGWEILPKALYDIAILLRDKYDNIPFYVTENGMGVEGEDLYRDPKTGMINDQYRISFISEHLEWIHKAIEEGCNCFGYHMWAIMDNWSFRNAFKNRYGFIEVDLSNMQRRKKQSALWLKEVSKANGFNDDYKKLEEVIDLKKVKFTPSV